MVCCPVLYLPYNPALNARARSLRRNMTPAEQTLWKQCLRHFPYRVLRQRPIDNFHCGFLLRGPAPGD